MNSLNSFSNQEQDSEIDCSNVYVSNIPNKGLGVFAKKNFSKNELIEKGVVRRIKFDGNQSPYLFTWSEDKTVWAFGSGCSTFYNTSRNPNTIMTRYFDEDRYEIHALHDIEKETELTHKYRSLEWRDCFDDLRQIEDL